MKKSRLILSWGLYTLIFLISLYLVIVFSVWFGYENKFRPGVSVAGFSVSGLGDAEVKELIDGLATDFTKRDPMLTINGQKYKASDFEIEFRVGETIKKVKEAKGNPLNINEKRDHSILFSYNQDSLLEVIREIDDRERVQVSNPSIKEDGSSFREGQSGKRIIYGEAVYQFKKAIGFLETNIEVESSIIKPIYDLEELLAVLPQVEAGIEEGVVLSSGVQEFVIDKSTLISWISLDKKELSMVQDYYLYPLREERVSKSYFSRSEVENYLKTISDRIDSEPVNLTLGTEGEEMVIRSPSQKGSTLNILESTNIILESLNDFEKNIDLIVDETEAFINENSLDELGLVGLVATGYSDFSGSPQNRRHNIRVGAEKFDGLLLEPNEIFSFTANMGAINAANGYLPELIIIGNETRPEYGGGLCQVSTTAFRAALNAGFPITARKAHSYPVTYYQPHGTDATIYNPNPDLKFKNDTGAYLLIQTRISGNRLYFDFYGTKKEVDVKFAGNKAGSGSVDLVEEVTPYTYDHGQRGRGSFKAIVYRLIYDKEDNLIVTDEFFSNYDSPDKYPR